MSTTHPDWQGKIERGNVTTLPELFSLMRYLMRGLGTSVQYISAHLEFARPGLHSLAETFELELTDSGSKEEYRLARRDSGAMFFVERPDLWSPEVSGYRYLLMKLIPTTDLSKGQPVEVLQLTADEIGAFAKRLWVACFGEPEEAQTHNTSKG